MRKHGRRFNKSYSKQSDYWSKNSLYSEDVSRLDSETEARQPQSDNFHGSRGSESVVDSSLAAIKGSSLKSEGDENFSNQSSNDDEEKSGEEKLSSSEIGVKPEMRSTKKSQFAKGIDDLEEESSESSVKHPKEEVWFDSVIEKLRSEVKNQCQSD